MLVVLSMALFVVPESAREVQAQSGVSDKDAQTHLCINRQSASNNIEKAYLGNNGTQCRPGWDNYDSLTSDRGLCISRQSVPVITKSPKESGVILSADGRQFCYYDLVDVNGDGRVEDANSDGEIDDPDEGKRLDFKSFSSITAQYTPPGSGNGNGNGNGNNGNGNSGNGNSGNGNGNSGGNTNNPPQVQGDCETGFHKVGPLCVPDSPFTNKDALVNSADAPGLAVRIIRVLLYFAGIVAVIMSIIGGYRIMTAQGNEAQATSGRKTLTNAIIGLVIVILSYIIIQAVVNFITK